MSEKNRRPTYRTATNTTLISIKVWHRINWHPIKNNIIMFSFHLIKYPAWQSTFVYCIKTSIIDCCSREGIYLQSSDIYRNFRTVTMFMTSTYCIISYFRYNSSILRRIFCFIFLHTIIAKTEIIKSIRSKNSLKIVISFYWCGCKGHDMSYETYFSMT